MFNPERVPFEARVLECRALFQSLNEPGQLVIPDATIDDLIDAGFITFGFEGVRRHPEQQMSGIVFELRLPDLPTITLIGKTIPERPTVLSFEYELPEQRALLARWIFNGSPEPTRRASTYGGEYAVTPVTQKLLASINGYAYRVQHQLLQYVYQQSIT